MIIANKQTATVALGGGGARGVAHLGVIESLQATQIDINRYVGVSIGALAGALCAADSDTARVQQRVIDYLTSERFQTKQAALFSTAPAAEEPATSGLFAWYQQIKNYLGARRKLAALFRRPALLGADVMQDVVDALIPDIDIADTITPLSIVVLDLLSGRRVVLTRGSLKTAVIASAAIPGVFPPIATNGMLLCDIGMMDAVPTKLAKSYGAELTIAVDVGGKIEPIETCDTAADIFLRLSDIGEPLVREYSHTFADIIIRPNVSHYPWCKFSDPETLIQQGRVAVRRSRIQRKLWPAANSMPCTHAYLDKECVCDVP